MRACSAILLTTLLSATASAQWDVIRVAVHAPDGTPIRGAKVRFRLQPGQTGLDVTDANRRRYETTLPTNASGLTAFQAPVAYPYRIEVDHAPFAIEQRGWVYAGSEIAVTLRSGGNVSGLLIRDDDVPLAGEHVSFAFLDGSGSRSTRTDDDGRFRFERVQPGWIEVSAPELAEGVPPETHRFPVSSDGAHELRFDVARGVELTGRVVDRDSGEPIPNAEVGIGGSFDKRVECDASGRYRMLGFHAERAGQVFARAPLYATAAAQKPWAIEGRLVLDVSLEGGTTIRGRVLDVNGQPARDCLVAAVGDGIEFVDRRETRTDEQGRYEIRGLGRGNPVLVVRKELRATTIHELPRALAGSELDIEDVRLRPRRIIQGRIVTPGGSVSGQRIIVHGSNGDTPAHLQNPRFRTSHVVLSLCRRDLVTDQDGRFFVGDLAPGDYEIEYFGRIYPVKTVEPGDERMLEISR
ncbi:MAG: hypothetical protein KDB80_10890 [Planctomycetes bacterium]|nr:hypothetical protein [Planctomycetota bacterium]